MVRNPFRTNSAQYYDLALLILKFQVCCPSEHTHHHVQVWSVPTPDRDVVLNKTALGRAVLCMVCT